MSLASPRLHSLTVHVRHRAAATATMMEFMHHKPLMIDGSRTTLAAYQDAAGSLKDEANKAFHALLIRRVLVGKFLEHEFFLVPQFDPNAYEH
jgi:hypothetical protein